MTTLDPVWATVAELSRAFGARTLSPVDAVDALMKRIAKRNPTLQAYIAVYEADARLAAEAADKAIRSGHRVGPLHGVPIALKDLVDLEGRVTTGGSKVWAKRVSPVTATLAEKLIAAGMIVLGKTHTVEFAMGSWGTNTHMGTPRNPWDLRVHRTPGGSSSGSGVAVAAGLAPAAIGTDTGGSVRIPAAWNGIVGLKVTVGRISTWGVLPLSSTLDTPGPLARTVEDAALIYNALSGPDPRDPQTLAWTPVDPLPSLRRGVAGLRLAVLPDAERAGVDNEILAAYDVAVDTLAKLGAQIVRVALPHRLQRLRGGHRADHQRGGLSIRRSPRRRREAADGPARAAAHPARPTRLGARLSFHARGARRAQARVRHRARGRRRAADADGADGGDSHRQGRSGRHRRALHAAGELPRAVRRRRPERLHLGRDAGVAPDPLPPRERGDGPAHRLELRAGDRLYDATAAGALTHFFAPSTWARTAR